MKFLPTLLGSLLLLASPDSSHASKPSPDRSVKCLSCQALVKKAQEAWTDSETVAEKLISLQEKCATSLSTPEDVATCDKIVAELVQIPPALFEGMLSLAWPVPAASCALIRQCQMPCCAKNAPPEQIHLSLASTDRSLMGVSWVTLEGEDSQIQYGYSADELSMTESGAINTYHSASWIGQIHRATMTNLKEDTEYFYRVGSDSGSWSEIISFKTLSSQQEKVSFAVIGDMAYDTLSDDTIASLTKLVSAGKIDAVIHSGDISYADGYENHFDDFMNKIQPIASKVPYMVSPGNHEFWSNFSSYKNRFFMPGVLQQEDAGITGGSGDNMYYSWEYGPAHFVSLNSETAIDVGQFHREMLTWADVDMSSVDRSKTPWLVTHYHRPTYCSNDHACEEMNAGRLRFQTEHLFNSNGVDVALQGHVHAYERTFKVFHQGIGLLARNAPVYILQGSSGNREMAPTRSTLSDEVVPEWSAAKHAGIGYGIMAISKETLQWDFFESGTDELVDSMTLTK